MRGTHGVASEVSTVGARGNGLRCDAPISSGASLRSSQQNKVHSHVRCTTHT